MINNKNKNCRGKFSDKTCKSGVNLFLMRFKEDGRG